MTRYFKTANASRPFEAGGFVFHFVPTISLGGRTEGVYVTSRDEEANALANHGPPIREITLADYEDIQKKKQRSTPSISLWRKPIEGPQNVPSLSDVATRGISKEETFKLESAPPSNEEAPRNPETLITIETLEPSNPQPAPKRKRK